MAARSPDEQSPLGKRFSPPSDHLDDRLQDVRGSRHRKQGYDPAFGDCLHPGNATRTLEASPGELQRTPPRSNVAPLKRRPLSGLHGPFEASVDPTDARNTADRRTRPLGSCRGQ